MTSTGSGRTTDGGGAVGPAGATASGRPLFRAEVTIWLLVLIWAANFSVVKASLADFRPLAFNALRFVLASGILAIILRKSALQVRFDRRDWISLVWLGLLGNTAYQVLFIVGIDWTLAGNAALMLATVPVFATLLSGALGHERIGAWVWVGVLLSLAGIALVVWGGAKSVRFGVETVRGDLIMLAAAVAWSVYTVGSSPLLRRYGTLPVTAVTMWIGAAGLLAASAPSLLDQHWSAIRPAAWAGLVYSGALAIALAYLLWYYSVRTVGAARTALYSNTIPVVALLIAWITLGEIPTRIQVIGTIAVVAGIALARRPPPRATVRPPCPPE